MTKGPRSRPHTFHHGGDFDAQEMPICTCGSVRSAAVHRVRVLDEDVRAAEARRVGESHE